MTELVGSANRQDEVGHQEAGEHWKWPGGHNAGQKRAARRRAPGSLTAEFVRAEGEQ